MISENTNENSREESTKYKLIADSAAACGFTNYGPLNMDSLVFRSEIRAMCSADKCHNYGRSWSCPPATPTLEAITNQVSLYQHGILLQTTDQLDDEFDVTNIGLIAKKHQKNFDNLVRQLRKQYDSILPMGAGGCSRCIKCTYPDRPCRYPAKLYHSMEAYGLWVSEVCEKSDIPYNYGPKTMTYTSCILYN